MLSTQLFFGNADLSMAWAMSAAHSVGMHFGNTQCIHPDLTLMLSCFLTSAGKVSESSKASSKATVADKSLPCLQFTNSVRAYFSAHGWQVNGKHYTEYAKLWVRPASTSTS